MRYYWNTPSIVEIIGQKGTGKTSLALKFGLDYAKENPTKRVKILNCAGGITSSRLNPWKSVNYDYADIFSVEDIQEILTNLKAN
jgi:hypothetical protein